MRNRIERFILAVCLVGLLLALYAVPLHYSSDGSRLCNIGETFNCDKVNKSPWSEFLGVPVAILGTISYLGFFLLVYLRKPIQRSLAFTDKDLWGYLALVAIVMAGFQGYLTLAEVLWIQAYCIVCLGSQAATIALAVLGVISWRRA